MSEHLECRTDALYGQAYIVMGAGSAGPAPAKCLDGVPERVRLAYAHVVAKGSGQDEDVKDLMRCANVVKRARSKALWDPGDVETGAYDVERTACYEVVETHGARHGLVLLEYHGETERSAKEKRK